MHYNKWDWDYFYKDIFMSTYFKIMKFNTVYKIAGFIALGFIMLAFAPSASHAACGFDTNGDYICDGGFTPPASTSATPPPADLGPLYTERPPLIEGEEPCVTNDDIVSIVEKMDTNSTKDSVTNHANTFFASEGNDCGDVEEFIDDLLQFEAYMEALTDAPCGYATAVDSEGDTYTYNKVPKPVFAAYLQEKIAVDLAWADNLDVGTKGSGFAHLKKTRGYLCGEIEAKSQMETAQAKSAAAAAAAGPTKEQALAAAKHAVAAAQAAAKAARAAADAATAAGSGAAEAAAVDAAASAIESAAAAVLDEIDDIEDPLEFGSILTLAVRLEAMSDRAADMKTAVDDMADAATEMYKEAAEFAGQAADAAKTAADAAAAPI